ncbi:hypothetical protein L596_015788 [Steinernema carpocapsae]|uniref:Nuclear receptor domain-containing protein n=1 Tax=Steinernema carpocapsae TaxID=34508 RepID=A0A4U5NGZ8_STECR|nr:hypothetical protein L596_015788 [Steinernema carpocapsae]
MSSECLVCSDHSDGQHFGIFACRACAAFFRRSTVSGKIYKCRFSNRCEIGKDVRCMCRACRLKKCLKMGMNVKSVQRYRDELGKRLTEKSHCTKRIPMKPLLPLPQTPSLLWPHLRSLMRAMRSLRAVQDRSLSLSHLQRRPSWIR